MLVVTSTGFGGETVRGVGSQTIRRDSARSALAGSTRPRVVTLRESTPLPPTMVRDFNGERGCTENISNRVPLTVPLAVPPAVPPAVPLAEPSGVRA